MKLLVFTEYFPSTEHGEVTGGVEVRALGLLRELAKKHHVTVICSYQGKQPRVSQVAGVEVIRVGMVSPYANAGNIVPRLVYAVSAFVTGLVIAKPDVIDGYSYLNYPIASLVGACRQTPVVLTYHESWSAQEWIALKGWVTGTLGAVWTNLSRLLPYTRVIAVSNATKRRLAEQDFKNIDVVYNGIDTAMVAGVTARKMSVPSVVCAARLIKSKRIDVLIDAVAELKKTIPNLKLTILGDGAELGALQKQIVKRHVQKQVDIITKTLKFKEQLRIMKQHRVFCLPSDVEGFGMAVVAAMAAGLPVVCTDIPVLREVTNNEGALHFAQGNPRDLAEKLKQLLTSTALAEQKAKEALARAKRFEWATLSKEAERVYQKVSRGA